MSDSKIFSSKKDLEQIAAILTNYLRLPLSSESVPGSLLEGTLAYVRGGDAMHTYDFVDVVKKSDKCGWQVKSTKEATPVTWKRAKLPDSAQLITASEKNKGGIKKLGDAIIDFCNAHVRHSIEKYELNEIGYARLIVRENGKATYFERLLVTKDQPLLFDPQQFDWKWSLQRVNAKKEQLSALHGYHRQSGKKWFSWHGRGENQLHFNGEALWWPQDNDVHAITFEIPSPSQKIDFETLSRLLKQLDRIA